MKKVRYAVGAVGVLGAMPALGLIAPAATATAATQAPASPGKTVSLHFDAPQITCPHDRNSGQYSVGLSGHIGYTRESGCIYSVYGRIFKQNPPTGLWMRIRFWANGHSFHPLLDKDGHIGDNHGSVHWSSYPNVTGAQQVCEAIVPARSPSKVLYGPVCEPTGY